MLCCKLQPQNRWALDAHNIDCSLQYLSAKSAPILLLKKLELCGLVISHAAPVHTGKAV